MPEPPPPPTYLEELPAPVAELARAAVGYVRRAIGVEMDGSEESLAFLDHYAATTPSDRAELIDLLAPPLGAYFGEVVRRKLGGRWAATGGDARAFRVELEGCFLYFHPVGVAADVLARGAAEGAYDPQIAVAPADEEALAEELSRTPVEEDYYYSFTGRIETLERMVDLLVSRRLTEAPAPAPIEPAAYEAAIRSRQS